MDYLLVKHLHMLCAFLTIVFFVIRAYWSITDNQLLRTKLVRTAPHIIDTFLLAFGIYMLFTMGSVLPFIYAKLIGLLIYIVVGSIAIKRGRNKKQKIIAAIIAIIVFAYIVGAAITKSTLSWLWLINM